jgi:hypothetical protein
MQILVDVALLWTTFLHYLLTEVSLRETSYLEREISWRGLISYTFTPPDTIAISPLSDHPATGIH